MAWTQLAGAILLGPLRPQSADDGLVPRFASSHNFGRLCVGEICLSTTANIDDI